MTIKERMLNVLGNGMSPILAEMVFAQAAHETGNFTSPIFIANNNAFGMKMPVVRPTTAVKQQLGYAYYNTLEDSCKDYIFWQKFVGFPSGLQTVDQFVTGLHVKNYFEAPLKEYLAGVKHFYNLYF